MKIKGRKRERKSKNYGQAPKQTKVQGNRVLWAFCHRYTHFYHHPPSSWYSLLPTRWLGFPDSCTQDQIFSGPLYQLPIAMLISYTPEFTSLRQQTFCHLSGSVETRQSSAKWLWLRVKMSSGQQSSEGLTGAGGCPSGVAVPCGCWQEASGPHHMYLSMVLLECPYNMAPGFLQSE